MSDLPPLCRGLLIGCSYVGGMAMMSMLMDVYEGKSVNCKSARSSNREHSNRISIRSRTSRSSGIHQPMYIGRIREVDGSEEFTQLVTAPKSRHHRHRRHSHRHRRGSLDSSTSNSSGSRHHARSHSERKAHPSRDLGGVSDRLSSLEGHGRTHRKHHHAEPRSHKKHRRTSRESTGPGYRLEFSSRSLSGRSYEPRNLNRPRELPSHVPEQTTGFQPRAVSVEGPDHRVLEIRIPFGQDGVLGPDLPAEIEVSTSCGNANNRIHPSCIEQPLWSDPSRHEGHEAFAVHKEDVDRAGCVPCVVQRRNDGDEIDYSPLRGDVCAVCPMKLYSDARAPAGVEFSGDRKSKDSSYFSTFESHTLGYSPARTTVSTKLPVHARGNAGVDFMKDSSDIRGILTGVNIGSSETIADGLLTESSFHVENLREAGVTCPPPSHASSPPKIANLPRNGSDEDFKTTLTWRNFSVESGGPSVDKSAGKLAVENSRKFKVTLQGREKFAAGDKLGDARTSSNTTSKRRHRRVDLGRNSWVRDAICSPIVPGSFSPSGRGSRQHSPFSISTYRFQDGGRLVKNIREAYSTGSSECFSSRTHETRSSRRRNPFYRDLSLPPAPRPSPVDVIRVEAQAQTSTQQLELVEVAKDEPKSPTLQSHDSGVDKTGTSLVERTRTLASTESGSPLMDLLLAVMINRLRDDERALLVEKCCPGALVKKRPRKRKYQRRQLPELSCSTTSGRLERILSGDDKSESTSTIPRKRSKRVRTEADPRANPGPSTSKEKSENDEREVVMCGTRNCDACGKRQGVPSVPWTDPAVFSKAFKLGNPTFRGKRRDMHPAQPPEPFHCENYGHFRSSKANSALRS